MDRRMLCTLFSLALLISLAGGTERNTNVSRGLASPQAVNYFFFRFCRTLSGPLRASCTASRARRTMMGFRFGGKASGCPIAQSVLFLFEVAMLLEWHS